MNVFKPNLTQPDEGVPDLAAIRVVMLPDGRMDTTNAALYLGLKPKTLAMMRCEGTGPQFIKKGRIFYFKSDLDAWLDDGMRYTSTNQVRFYQGQEALCDD